MLCVVDSELTNLEIALVARELRPDIRVVSQLGNQAIGRAVAGGNGPGAVLDVATLAAPAIVEACLSRRVHEIGIGDETFLVATLPVDRASTLRGLFGDLAPIAVVRHPPDQLSAPVVVDCPGRDFEVQPGDFAAMLGTTADFERQGIDLDRAATDPVKPAHTPVLARMKSVAAGIAGDFDRGFYFASAALVLLVTAPPSCCGRATRNPA